MLSSKATGARVPEMCALVIRMHTPHTAYASRVCAYIIIDIVPNPRHIMSIL